MREILFRGKRLDNGEWVYGDLENCKMRKKTFIHTYFDDGKYHCQFEVAPDTVGQYTGLTDKNGTKIFEGDIVDCWSQGRHCTNGIVTWMEHRIFITIKGKDGHVVDNWHIMPNNNGIDEGLSVIGNIYDNNTKNNERS